MLRQKIHLTEGKQKLGLRNASEAALSYINPIRIIYIICKCSEYVIDLTKQTKQNKPNSLIRELAGDIIGCVSLMVLFFVTLFIAGVYH